MKKFLSFLNKHIKLTIYVSLILIAIIGWFGFKKYQDIKVEGIIADQTYRFQSDAKTKQIELTGSDPENGQYTVEFVKISGVKKDAVIKTYVGNIDGYDLRGVDAKTRTITKTSTGKTKVIAAENFKLSKVNKNSLVLKIDDTKYTLSSRGQVSSEERKDDLASFIGNAFNALFGWIGGLFGKIFG